MEGCLHQTVTIVLLRYSVTPHTLVGHVYRFKFMWRVHIESVSADRRLPLTGADPGFLEGGANNYIHKWGWVGGGVPSHNS